MHAIPFPSPAAVLRAALIVTADAAPPARPVAARCWELLKEAQGKPLDLDRWDRMMATPSDYPGAPLILPEAWRVVNTPLPADRRSPADHARAARRNRLCAIMGRL
ncbi:hypothetical protein [Ponticoccus alexandrii]|uniref:Uncharacterized protein n=1 Tax=Ponticoccus alexandrii TaxID=1943633 RepID=A0ABX7F895_9RHOB|nr:hypothetical protein [Ponticoccus alexandrii]ETA54006.1 hypothetical protein P279_00215 [Rhodobacteraceae bacterium PD-2]QRF66356.1 hypothetical protein GQA70_08565 [Ponticoccus alexandrii]